MKNNLISSIASWKSAALLGLVALIATVAFSGLLSTTQTADALTSDPDLSSGPVPPGTSVNLTTTSSGVGSLDANSYVLWSISTTGNAKAVFTHNQSTTLSCLNSSSTTADPTKCDTGTDADAMTVKVKVADDSGDGAILVTATSFADASNKESQVIAVSTALVPTALKATVAAGDEAVSVSDATGVTITGTLTSAAGTGVAGKALRFSTSLGVLTCGNDTEKQECTSEVTNASGVATAVLKGSNRPGKATVTVTELASGQKGTVDIVLFGTAAKISVAADQGAIEIGGSTFVVVTVTDSGGNAVEGKKFSGADATTAGPSKTATGLVISHTATKAAVPAAIPTCYENVNTDTEDGGTNAKGQCVIKVFAPKKSVDPDGAPIENIDGSNPATVPAKDATRGAHTVTVAVTATSKATATINVGGPVNSITSDAPERVDPLSETAITVTVWDDEDVPVGAVTIRVDKVEGAGLITSGTTKADDPATTDKDEATKTSDGQHKFTYLAPRGGTAVFRVQAGTGAGAKVSLIEVNIGDAAPAATWSATPVSGWNNLTWMGESGASVADNIPEGVTAVYHWNAASQSWDAYFAGADDVPGGMDFSTLTNGASYWIASN